MLGIPEWAVSAQGQHASLLSAQRDSPDNFSLYLHPRLSRGRTGAALIGRVVPGMPHTEVTML
jgi:hypothetical protein